MDVPWLSGLQMKSVSSFAALMCDFFFPQVKAVENLDTLFFLTSPTNAKILAMFAFSLLSHLNTCYYSEKSQLPIFHYEFVFLRTPLQNFSPTLLYLLLKLF